MRLYQGVIIEWGESKFETCITRSVARPSHYGPWFPIAAERTSCSYTTAKWTAPAACKIPLRVQDGNLRVPSLRQYTSLLLFSFALHSSNITHSQILKRKTYENSKKRNLNYLIFLVSVRSVSSLRLVCTELIIILCLPVSPLCLGSKPSTRLSTSGLFTKLSWPLLWQWTVCMFRCMWLCAHCGLVSQQQQKGFALHESYPL